MEKFTGIIKFYNSKKKYGFIKRLYREEEIFFHVSNVCFNEADIQEGCVVSYLKSNDKNKREKAISITIVADGKLETVKKLDDYITRIIDIADSIQPYKLTILTGSNGRGKSFIRKLMNSKMGEKFPDTDPKKLIAEVSMQKRTDINNSLYFLIYFAQKSPYFSHLYNVYKVTNNDKHSLMGVNCVISGAMHIVFRSERYTK